MQRNPVGTAGSMAPRRAQVHSDRERERAGNEADAFLESLIPALQDKDQRKTEAFV